MKIGRDTYGLFLISNNCHNITDYANYIDEAHRLTPELDNEEEGIEVMNSWTLVGVHDTAILVRANGQLDSAVNAMGKWVADCTSKSDKISFRGSILPKLDLNPLTRCKCECVSNLFEGAHVKNFRVFEYRVDPLIPIYVDDDAIRNSDGVLLIEYIKFDPLSVNRILNEEDGTLEDIYGPFKKMDGVVALFHGFGLFDVVFIAKLKTYKDVMRMRIAVRNISEPFISNTYSLTSIATSSFELGFESLNCSMMVKVKPHADDPDIWNGLREIARDLGLKGLHIRRSTGPDRIGCPLHTSFRPGFFDVAIDMRFEKIVDLTNFASILEYMPFVEDTATVIGYDTNDSIMDDSDDRHTTV
jgi:hypothetical protein